MFREEVWQGGLQVIRWLQEFRNPVLDNLMRGVTVLGTEEVYILLIGYLLWCGHPRVGLRLAGWLALAAVVNADLKGYFAHPRPFELDPDLQLIYTRGYGLPSGHAQLSVVVWGYLATRKGSSWFRCFAVFFIFLIGLSRVYLGVHFPSDVLVGWLVGLMLLVGFLVFERLPFRRLRGRGHRLALPALVLSVAAILLFPVSSAAKPLGLLAAFAVVVLAGEAVWEEEVPEGFALSRFLVGLTGILATEGLFRMTRILVPFESESAGHLAVTFIGGFVLGLWLFGGAFFVFRSFGWSRPVKSV